MDDLTGFQRDLLIVIAGLDEPNGLEIKDEIEEYYESTINHGRLYPNLDALVEGGLVEKRQQDERTNAYRLSDDGWETLESRREWEHKYVEGMEADSPSA
ncbi:MAG: PadR family transcriptional regulator [Halodesulfurarchaeum sp.]